MTITYKNRPGYSGGGVIAVGNTATAYNVGAGLTAGGGQIVTSDYDLVNALDKYAPVYRFSDDGSPLYPSVEMRLNSLSTGNHAGLSDRALEVKLNTEPYPRWQVLADGTMSGGNGTVAPGPFTLASEVSGVNVPTTNEKAALAGTSGSPSVSNKYVTNADARLSAAAGPAGGVLSGTYPNPALSAGTESRIATAESDINTLESEMNTAQSDITTLESEMNTAQADITALELGVGTLIDVQRLKGSNNNYVAISTGSLFYMDAGLTVPMRFVYTPPVNVWWEVRFNVGVLQKTDAAYHYGYVSAGLTTLDVDGHQAAYQIFTQHSTVDTFGFRAPTKVFKLAASTSYTCNCIFTASGGSWQYYQGDAYHFAESKAWVR